MTTSELRKLIQETIRQQLKEDELIPTGPDGEKIDDPRLVSSLKKSLAKVDPSFRKKLESFFSDPDSSKALASKEQRVAVIEAIAIAFGINEQEFSAVVNTIKKDLKAIDNTTTL